MVRQDLFSELLLNYKELSIILKVSSSRLISEFIITNLAACRAHATCDFWIFYYTYMQRKMTYKSVTFFSLGTGESILSAVFADPTYRIFSCIGIIKLLVHLSYASSQG